MATLQPDILLRDSLTQVYSRSALNSRLPEEVNRAMRYGQTFSILLLDIDYFKSINDAFGHLRGDEILSELARRVTQIVRKTDIVFRYGGDEFLIILPNTDNLNATNLGLRLLEQIRATPFPGVQPLTVTISAGIASFPEDAQTPEALFEIADQRHYSAKSHGRNRLVFESASTNKKSIIEEVSRLIERDQALTSLHHFLDTLPDQGRGVLRVVADPGCGSSRFLIETRKAANLRGFATLNLKGKKALKYRLNSVIYEAFKEALPAGIKEFHPGVFDPTNEKQLLGILGQWTEEKGKRGLVITLDDIQEIDRSSLSAVRTLFHLGNFPILGLVYTDRGNIQLRGFPFDISLQGVVKLNPLTQNGIVVWLRHALQWEPPSDLVEWLYHETQGLPENINNSIKLLQEERILKSTGNGWEVTQNFSRFPLKIKLQQVTNQPPQNLPDLSTELVGRHEELRKLQELLIEERLVTIYGSGGVGKSRLALQSGAENLERFPQGVFYVSPETSHSPDQLEYAIANALKINLNGTGSARDQLTDYLLDKELLLIIDDFDRVPGSVESLSILLGRVPLIHCLVCSRSRTGIPMEHPFELKGLSYPEVEEKTSGFEAFSAVELFYLCARRVHPDFFILEGDKTDIARICKFVAGNPLGLELAAAMINVVPLGEITRQLEKNLANFENGSFSNANYMKSIQSILDSFWLLLSKPEQEILCKLSIFEGSFTEEAGRAISGASLFFLDALSDKSILLRDAQGRYRLHVLLRQHLSQKLGLNPDECSNIQALHCQYYTNLVHKTVDLSRTRSDNTIWEAIANEITNIQSAWTWASENGRLDELNKLILGLFQFYAYKGQYSSALEILQSSGQHLEQYTSQQNAQLRHQMLGKIFVLSGIYLARLGRYEAGISKLEQAIAIFKQIDDDRETSLARYELSDLYRASGDYSKAIQLLEECLAYYSKINDLPHTGDVLNSLGLVFSACGNIIKSEHLYRESLSIFKAIDDQNKRAVVLNNLGNLAIENDRLPEAKEIFEESLVLTRQGETRELKSSILNSLGNISLSKREYIESEDYLKEALQLRYNLNSTPLILESLVSFADLWACQGKNQQAYEMLLEIRDHPATSHANRVKALEILEILSPQITSLPGPVKTENIENTVRTILYSN